MLEYALLAAAWIYGAFGLHTLMHLVPWSDTFIGVRWLPRGPAPDTVNTRRVVGTILYALVAFVCWPLIWRRHATRLGSHDDSEYREDS